MTELLAAAGRQDDPTPRSSPPGRCGAGSCSGWPRRPRRPARRRRRGGGPVRHRGGHAARWSRGSRPRGRERSAGRALPTRLLVVGMGRLGGHELGYGSDADVLFVHDPHAGRGRSRRRRTPPTPWSASSGGCSRCRPRTRRCWSTPTCGRRAGRARWSARSRRTPPTTPAGRWSGRPRPCCAPPRSPATRRWPRSFLALIDPLRWPAEGSRREAREIRRIKARVEAERLPRGADATLHTKLGRGGLERRRVDRAAAAAAARRAASRRCARPARWRRWP